MAERGAGSIVTTASGAIDTGARGLLCYSGSKAAVVQLTRTVPSPRSWGPMGCGPMPWHPASSAHR